MSIQCRLCGEQSPPEAFFCISCGAVLQLEGKHTYIRTINFTGPTVPIKPLLPYIAPNPSQPTKHSINLVRLTGIPLIGICFSITFLIGLMQVIEQGGLPLIGLWGIGPVVAGALIAEEAWINGQLWRGLFGMLVWGVLPWLLAMHLLLLGAMLCLAWSVLHVLTRHAAKPTPSHEW